MALTLWRVNYHFVTYSKMKSRPNLESSVIEFRLKDGMN